ncbi:MAG: hypothetical protein ACP5MG_12350 [Verrucomicrobiia bacterium]
MINSEKNWLDGFNWQQVVEVNRNVCQKEGVQSREGKGFEKAQKLWESSNGKPMKLVDALDLCRKVSQLEPFEMLNNNTFAEVARRIIEPHIPQASKLLRQMLLSTAAHYVVGIAKRRELLQVIDYFDFAVGDGQFRPTTSENKEKDGAKSETNRDSTRQSQPAGVPLR